MSQRRPYGPFVINGTLFFKLLDGSTITCECIKEPFASQVVAACRGELTQSELKRLLDYDPDTGLFRWKTSLSYRGTVGRIAGNKHDKHGRTRISIANRQYFAHRLAWMWMTGEFPTNDVDHINGNPSDNRWNNLRVATRSENLCNRLTKSSSGGFRGVYWKPRDRRWIAKIQIGGRQIYLGSFDDPQKANEAYKEAAKKLHGDFAFHRDHQYGRP